MSLRKLHKGRRKKRIAHKIIDQNQIHQPAKEEPCIKLYRNLFEFVVLTHFIAEFGFYPSIPARVVLGGKDGVVLDPAYEASTDRLFLEEVAKTQVVGSPPEDEESERGYTADGWGEEDEEDDLEEEDAQDEQIEGCLWFLGVEYRR